MVNKFIIDGLQYRINSDGSSVTVTAGEKDLRGELILSPFVQFEGESHKVTKVGESAFEDCVGLTSVKIPDTVTEIDRLAFAGCRGLSTVKIPATLTEIRSWAFARCSGLTSIVVDSENAFYDSRDNCNAIIETATNTLIAGCMNTVIPDTVTEIANKAFCDCNVTSVRIPESVTEISNMAFIGCGGLVSIIVESGNPRYDSRHNCNAIIETATNTLIAGCMSTVIPDSVTRIDDIAFCGHCGLTSIVIPDSVEEIGGWAFAGCEELKSVVMPHSISISICAFNGTPWEMERWREK
ncbi:MAG: leucine-rich repeat domain-containing protein [Muribaculaceae bacterium]|nr:leucine-rich repeat domain-containing protein [Muribaculaceae bacterium]